MSENLADKQKSGPSKMADEAVVPQVSHIPQSMLPPVPFNPANSHMLQGMSALFEGFSNVNKPQMGYDHSVAMMQAQGTLGFPGMSLLPSGVVPQLNQQLAAKRLTAAQQSELEMARRRAQKAAEGKRANATAARRAKRKAMGQPARAEAPAGPVAQVAKDSDQDDEANQADEDLEARLAASTSEKESKRLKRLLRNRVSAQQARERKKQFVTNLESKLKDTEQRLMHSEEERKKLERENVMLRNVLRNTQAPGDSVVWEGLGKANTRTSVLSGTP